jgi:hypothetical protein
MEVTLPRERRRSPRISIRVLLHAGWKIDDQPVLCDAITVSVNAHGALLKVLSETAPAPQVVLENIANREVQEVRVISAAPVPAEPGAYMVAVEFSGPEPQFWKRVYSYSNRRGIELIDLNDRLVELRVEEEPVLTR